MNGWMCVFAVTVCFLIIIYAAKRSTFVCITSHSTELTLPLTEQHSPIKSDFFLYFCKNKMWFKLLLIYLPFACFAELQVEPSIVRISSQQTKNVGENVELECVVRNAENYVVIWQRMNPNKHSDYNTIITAGRLIVTVDSRFSITVNEVPDAVNTQIHTLQIKDVDERDAGTYRCSYSSPQSVPADVVLTVQLLPSA